MIGKLLQWFYSLDLWKAALVVAARTQCRATNSTVNSFFAECMSPWPDGKIGGSCITTGAIHKAYIQWRKTNNNGYARSAKEFRDELAIYLGTKCLIKRRRLDLYLENAYSI